MILLLNDPKSIARAALNALDARQEEAGLELARRGQARYPSDAVFWQIEALLHRQCDELVLAIAAFQRAEALAPNDARIVHGHAVALTEAGLPALNKFIRARSLAPDDRSVIAGLIEALVAEGNLDAAIEGLEMLLAREPTWLEGNVLLASLRWQRGPRDDFARCFEAALRVKPTNRELAYNYIFVLLHAGHYSQALEVIARAVEAGGDSLVLTWSRAACFSELGDIEQADREFGRVRDVRDVPAQTRRIRHLLRSGRAQEAATEAESWIGTTSANDFWPYLSVAWRLLGDARSEWLEGDSRLVGVYDLANRLPDLPSLANKLRALHNVPGAPLVQSIRGGTQTEGNLFSNVDPLIRHLRNAILDTVTQHAAQLPIVPNHPVLSAPRHPIRFSASWSVRLGGQGCHSNHVHPRGWLSSALYVALPDTPDGIDRDPQAGWLTLGVPPSELRLGLDPIRSIEPRLGRLVLFPSTMWHGTRPFARGERLTVAFDVAQPLDEPVTV